MKAADSFSYAPVLMLLTLASPAWAAQAAPKDKSTTTIEEVTVTAQKRSQDIQDVPMSIVALSGSTLAHAQINNTTALQVSTPGLVVSTNGPFGQPYIRGVGTDILGVGSDSSVAINVDGVYMARPTAAVQNFYDIQRVEVLKGPQGTLYGRNATGGAINIITNKPAQQYSAGVDVTIGNYNAFRTTAYLNAPVGEASAFRVSVLRSSHDGYTKLFNPAGLPVNGRDLNGEDVYGGRLQFLTEPNSRLTVSLEADYTHEDDTRFLNNRPDPAFASITPAYKLGAVVPANIRRSTSDRPQRALVKDGGAHATIEYRLGDVQLKSITAFRHNRFDGVEDIDGTNLNIAWLTAYQKSDEVTQEFQLSSSGPKLDWLAGLYYFHEDSSSYINVFLGGAFNPFSGLNLPSSSDNFSVHQVGADNTTNAYAAFGQATYNFTHAWSLTLGARYSYETKDFLSNNILSKKIVRENASWGSFTPKVGMQYRFNDKAMAYVTIDKGFKSGGFNDDGIGEKFNPESIWSYEAGIKATWLRDRLLTNFDGFYYDYSNLQVRVRDKTGTGEIVANVGSAKVYGLEATTEASLTDRFHIKANLSYLVTRIGNGVAAYDTITNSNVNVGGNRLPRAPKWTAMLSGTYVVPVSTGDLSFAGEYRYQSDVFFDVFNRNLSHQAGYSLVNARIRYDNDNNWYAGIWANNLTDNAYKASVIYNGIGGSLDFYAPPRTFGVQFGVKF